MNSIMPNITDYFPDLEEKWVEKKPQKGDHIRVQRLDGLYAHHGIYISDDEVIHFTGRDDDSILDGAQPEVISTNLDFFLKDGTLEVKEYTLTESLFLYPTERIVEKARSGVGKKGYNLAFNNCEHFANRCTLGLHKSNQVDRVIKGKIPNDQNKRNPILFDPKTY